MDEKGMEANRQLAELLGWTEIVNVGGAWLGRPPGGSQKSRDQAKVPDWTGDWRDCGPLISDYGLLVEKMDYGVRAGGWNHNPSDYPSEDAAVRAAIVGAVITRLRACQ